MIQTKKIKFFYASSASQHHLPQIQYILRTGYDLEGKYPEAIEWLPNFVGKRIPDLAWQEIVDEQPDIICFSLYLWTADFIHDLAKKVREHFPHITLILGGPDVRWKDYENYINEHPYYDYFIYGEGEDSFVKLMDRHLEGKTSTMDLMNVPNLFFRSKSGKPVKTKYEVYKGKIFTEVSALFHCEFDLARDVARARALGIETIWYVWEFDRGCPYNCSFCDWSAGLHHKVTRKKYNAIDEVELFKKYDLSITISNANVGMFPDDWKWLEALHKNNIMSHEPSWAKNHKKNVFEIIAKEVREYGRAGIKLPVQTLSDIVLDNIDRPGASWLDIKEFVNGLRAEGYTDLGLGPEMIQGLPGETRESIDYAALELIDMIPISSIWQYMWHVLPNSPASDPAYQEKFGIKIYPTFVLEHASHHRIDNKGFANLSHDEVVDVLLHPENHSDMLIKSIAMGFVADIAWDTYTSSWEQLCYQNIALGTVTALQARCHGNKKLATAMYKQLRPRMWEVACQDAKRMREQYQKYGVIPFYVIKGDKIYPYDAAWSILEVGLSILLGEHLAYKVVQEKHPHLVGADFDTVGQAVGPNDTTKSHNERDARGMVKKTYASTSPRRWETLEHKTS
jgi:radical SAM superfamily enzyme YgiQ (UPF0313 family)